MPELPEVETIKLGLQQYLIGHKIESVEIKVPKLFEGEVENVVGAKVKEVRRFGKGLVIDLSNGYSIAIHIKLTGQLIYRGRETAKIQISKHDPEVIKRVMDGILIFEKEGGYGAAFLTGALLVWRMIYSENPYTSVDYSGVDFDNHISRLLEEGGIGSAYEQRALENRNIHEFIRNRRFETQEETFAFRAGAGGMYELKRRACELEEKDRIH